MSKDDKKHDLIGHNLETRSFTAESIHEFKNKLNELNNQSVKQLTIIPHHMVMIIISKMK